MSGFEPNREHERDTVEQPGHGSTTEFLQTLLRAGLAFFPLLILASLFLFHHQKRLLTATYTLLLLVTLLSWWLLRRGKTALASALVLGATWSVVTGLTIASGGLQTGGIGYMLVVLIAGLLWGTRVGILTGILSVLAALAIAVAESQGLLPARPETVDTQRLLISVAAGIFWCVLLLHLGFRDLRRALEQAARNERKFADLVRDLPDPVMTLNETGMVLACNRAASTLSGFRENEIVGRHFANPDWMSLPERQRALLRFQALLEGEREANFELEILSKQGHPLQVEVNPAVVSHRGRRHIRLVIRDITERHRAEQELRAVEKSYREIFEQAPVMYVITRAAEKSPVIDDCNEQFAEQLGYSRDELIGKPLVELYTAASNKELLDRGGYQRALEGVFTAEERQLVTKNGEILETLLRAAPVKGLDGGLTGTRAAYVDITENKKVQEALRLSEERYTRLFEGSMDAVFITTPKGVLLDINPAGVEMFGFDSKEEMLAAGAPLSLYQNPEDRDLLNKALANRGFVKDYELSLVTKKGEQLTVLETATAVRNADGELVAGQGILRDVTHRRSLERQLRQAQRLEAIGRLAGGVAHDFNNLLTLIIGYTELLLKNTDPADTRREALEQIQDAGQRATTLTRQLLAFTRQQVLEPKVLNLNSVIQAIEDLLRRTLGETLHLDLQLQPDLHCSKVDPGQIDQILMNLTVNARDAMPTGGTIQIKTSNVDLDKDFAGRNVGAAPGLFVMIELIDDGSGMDEETRSRVFEPFFTTKDKGQGTGLGLSTVYGIVKQSGGYITVSSVLGKGTTFRLYFPRSDEADRVVASAPPPVGLARGTETVLVVEDDDNVRALVSRTLTDLGYEVIAAANAEEGLRVFEERSGQIDLLLTDLVLPGANGLELAKSIQDLSGEVAVLTMSGYSGREMLDQDVIGISLPLLRKPFSTETLARKIRQTLERR